MLFSKTIASLSTLSFGLALMGSALVFAPSSAKAAGTISNGALSKNNIPCSIRGGNQNNCRVGAPVNPWKRPCTKQQRCRG
jgi:rapid alkalinization factor (RALF)